MYIINHNFKNFYTIYIPIQVVCRFRPLNEKEKNISQEYCCEFLDYSQVMVRSTSENNTYKFNFDRVFDPKSNQQEVYDFAAKHIVESVLEGFNGTIFAYGQTSSGKTHTMQGIIDNPEKEGIIPRMIRHMFNFIVNSSSDTEYIVKVSMIEIYMEKIKDLIDPERTNLNVREDKAKGIYIEDLSEHYVVSEDEVLEIMKLGSDNRSVAATNMNEHSSRSHSMFIMTIHQNNVKDLSAKTGKLYLVDLAGSEKISKTGATGLTLEEAKTINKSLTTLGMVINSLTDGKSTHIPYRESKLTRVLQESLGGNAKTCLIITCSPSIYNESETLSTLRFGLRAKKIKNKPKINKETTVAELKIEIDKMDKVIQKLNRRITQLEKYIIKHNLPLPPEDWVFDGDVEDVREVNIINDNLEENDNENELDQSDNMFNKLSLVKIGEGDLKVSLLNSNIENNLSNEKSTNNVQFEKSSRLTAAFGSSNDKDTESHNINADIALENLKKTNIEFKRKISELEEENKTLNEQIEFLHEFISRLDKELELKSNTIDNLEKLNKKLQEQKEISEQVPERYNQAKDLERNSKFLIDKEKQENSASQASQNDLNTDLNEYQENRQDYEINKTEKNESILNPNREEVNTSYNHNSPRAILDHNKIEDKIIIDNIAEINEINSLTFQSDKKNHDIEETINRNSMIIKNDIKLYNNSLNEDYPIDYDFNSKKLAEKEEQKRDLSLLEIFQKLKQERKLNKSTNFNHLENYLMNTDIFKKTIGCQTEEYVEDIQEKLDKNESLVNNINNDQGYFDYGNSMGLLEIKNTNKEFMSDIILKIENLNNKIKKESNLIENLNKIDYKSKSGENTLDNSISTNQEKYKNIFENNQSEKLESHMKYLIGQLDNFIIDYKNNLITNNQNNIYGFENMPNHAYTKEELDSLVLNVKSEFEEKLNNETKKHENEKKTILKVLEEKCEKYNLVEVQNGDLKKKIKSLEYKLSPDEKNYKKIFVRLEQNVDQLNLSLEKTVAEKTQLAINLKVFKNRFTK